MRAWRGLVVLAALFAAACSVGVNGGKGHGPYSVEIRSVGETQLYVVRGPNGKVAAARAGGGSSAFLDAAQMQRAFEAMPTPHGTTDNDDQSVSIHAPGFDLRARGDDVHVNDDSDNDSDSKPNGAHAAADTHDDDHDGGHGQVSMNIGGFGMHVDADEGGPGEADDRAQVTLTGMSEHDARHFIIEQDDLSPQVQGQMLAALGLSQDDDADDSEDGKAKPGK